MSRQRCVGVLQSLPALSCSALRGRQLQSQPDHCCVYCRLQVRLTEAHMALAAHRAMQRQHLGLLVSGSTGVVSDDTQMQRLKDAVTKLEVELRIVPGGALLLLLLLLLSLLASAMVCACS